jgi:SsrA-binding protein
MSKKKDGKKKGWISTDTVVAENRQARFDYEIIETMESGIMLTGTEVKSLRLGHCNIKESFVGPKGGEIWIFNLNIPEYQQAGKHLQHEPARARKLLLHKRQVNQLLGVVTREGMTIVARKIYFNDKGRVKLEISIGKGKKLHDKRETEKNRDWGRQKQRLLRSRD